MTITANKPSTSWVDSSVRDRHRAARAKNLEHYREYNVDWRTNISVS